VAEAAVPKNLVGKILRKELRKMTLFPLEIAGQA
jgi:hypothetical protein